MIEIKRLTRTFMVAAVIVSVAGAVHPAWSQIEGAGIPNAAKLDTNSGAAIYREICQGCHMPNGQGAVGAGKYPALAKDPALASSRFMALTLLEGRRNMPAFGGTGDVGLFFKLPSLSDEQIAAVINYVRSNFGNDYQNPISAAEVKALRRAR